MNVSGPHNYGSFDWISNDEDIQSPLGCRSRFANVAVFCDRFHQLPAFEKATGIFTIIDTIRSIVDGLPTLAKITTKIRETACDFAWACDSD
jgi:hypothetical protein